VKTSPRVKICCIQNVEEAELAIRYGASALGLVSEMPSGPGPIPEELIARIASRVPPGIDSFLLTSKQDPGAVIEQHRRTRTTAIQLVDSFPLAGYSKLRVGMPGIRIVQVIHVRNTSSLDEAVSAALHVDALLLDSGNPGAPVKELGGTGRTHDWDTSLSIQNAVRIPVYLAGGLKAENVAEAIVRVQPFGVDVCSGVRTNGMLDEAKLSAFFRNVAA
jgi:phosphoribosylanthranilate isomerase